MIPGAVGAAWLCPTSPRATFFGFRLGTVDIIQILGVFFLRRCIDSGKWQDLHNQPPPYIKLSLSFGSVAECDRSLHLSLQRDESVLLESPYRCKHERRTWMLDTAPPSGLPDGG